jgi:hypothetical protein
MSNEDSTVVWLAKIAVGVIVLLAIAALIHHRLVLAYGPADGDLIALISIPIGATGIGMLIMILTGEV